MQSILIFVILVVMNCIKRRVISNNAEDKQMLRKLMVIILVLLQGTTSIIYASETDRYISVTLPAFPVVLNGLEFDNNYALFPFLAYRNTIYFPMTYYNLNLLNLNLSMVEDDGIVITKDDPDRPKRFARDVLASAPNNITQTAMIIDSKVTINGNVIDNQNELFPLLFFRDVVYFPLTWEFAVSKLGWHYTFCSTAGLSIRADNFFYISAGSSGHIGDDYLAIGNTETYYFRGDLQISLITFASRGTAGAISSNLSIVRNYVEIIPNGFFGYFQEEGPFFTIVDEFVLTTYHYERDWRGMPIVRNVKVSIATGEMLCYDMSSSNASLSSVPLSRSIVVAISTKMFLLRIILNEMLFVL